MSGHPPQGSTQVLDRPDDPAAPVRPSRPRPATARRRPVRRVVLIVAAVLSGLILIMAGTANLLFTRGDANLRRIEAFGPNRIADTDGRDENVLLVGIDDRSTLTDAERERFHSGPASESVLTDTLMVLHVPGDGSRPVLVSIPRDSWVEVPGVGQTKINSAYARGGGGPAGVRLLAETVEQTTGMRLDHYMQIDMAGFARITDAVGGVTVCLKAPQKEKNSGIDLPAGEQTISGDQALAFVRQRHGLPNGDLDRVARQQHFIAATVDAMTKPSVILNPFAIDRLIQATTSSIVVDSGLDSSGIRELGFALARAGNGGLDMRTLPIQNATARVAGQSVVLLDEAAIPGFVQTLDPGSRPVAAASTSVVQPKDVEVRVQNGTGQRGLARTAADDLGARGYVVVGTPGNADRAGYSTSVIKYASGQEAQARRLAADVRGSRLERVDEATTITLIVGKNYDGVATAASKAPAPAPRPSMPATVTGAAAPNCVN